ncbi:MAG: hypothetical protein LIP01_07005 [Tannerellaceae bacterium]|nr:hypothetical protein [Tannerellaceae bacterium]
MEKDWFSFPYTTKRYYQEETRYESVLFSDGVDFWLSNRYWKTNEEFHDYFFIHYACYKALNYMAIEPPFASSVVDISIKTWPLHMK